MDLQQITETRLYRDKKTDSKDSGYDKHETTLNELLKARRMDQI